MALVPTSTNAFSLLRSLLPKRLSSVSFVGRQDPTEIIVSDSVGDVFTFPLSESCDATVEAEHEKRLMLAHFSLVTDCLVQGKLVASCDRDNRIRISRFPRSYVIEAFLLGHSDLVTCLAWVSDSLLLSGSADGSVCLWDVTTGECEPCSRLQLGDGEGEHRPMVISVDGWLSDGNFVVVVLENDPKLRVVRVASEGNNVEVAHEYAPPDCSGHITGALFDDAERLCVTSANYDGVGIYTFSASEEGNVTMDLCNTVVCSTAEKADDDSCDMGHLRPFWLTQLRRKSIDENWKGKKRKAASSL